MTALIATCHKFTNANIALLPKALPKVTVLDMRLKSCWTTFYNDSITDEGLIAMVEGFKFHDLRSLTMSVCDDVTDASLLKIVECCPRLHTLDLFGAIFHKKSVLDLILSRKLIAKKICLEPSESKWVEKKLKKASFLPIPRFWYNG